MSHGNCQIESFSTNRALPPRMSAYSEIRPRRTSLSSFSSSRSTPLSSTMYPLESEQPMTVPPSACTFSMA